MNSDTPFWNIPNILTLVRIGMVPVMAFMLWTPPKPMECILSCALFVIAMITDVIDGYLARKWNQSTPMGAYLDPLADKLMVTTVLIMLVPLGWAPAWVVALLMCREITITGLRSIASQRNFTLAASALGKIKTAFQSVAIGMLLWHHAVQAPLLGTVDIHSAGIVILYISLLFSLLSATEYFVLYYIEARKETKNAAV